MDVTCPSCAAENYDSARYCRKCGAQLGSAEFHEAPTRGLDHQRSPEPPPARAFETFGSAPLPNDGPRYAPPTVTPTGAGLQLSNHTGMPAQVETGPMHTGPVSKGPNWFLIIGAIVLAAFIGGVSMLVMVADRIRNQPDRAASGDGPPSKVGKGDNAPPMAPPPPGTAPVPGSLESWQYEGSTVTASLPGVLVMETDDDIGDVRDFYREKFDALGVKPGYVNDPDDEDVTFIGGPGAGNVVVVISPADAEDVAEGDGGKTEVVVTMGGAMPGFPGIPNIPGVPNVPDVKAPPEPPKPPEVPAPTKQPADSGKTQKSTK